MIEKMKKTAVLCQARHRDEVLGSLRDLGVMHLSDTPSHSQGLDALMAERESVVRTMQVLSERGGKGVAGRADGDFAAVDGEVQRLIAEEAALQGRIAALSSERERIALLGSFDPDAFRSLVDMGIFKGIWIGSDKDMKALAASEGVRFIEVAAEGKQRAAVILSGEIPEGLTLSRFALPEKPLDAIDSELSAKMEAAGKAAASIAAEAVHLPLYRAQLARLDEAISFEKAREAMAGDDIACITGYIPASDEAAFKEFAGRNGCAYMLSDPDDYDNPPTKIRYKGFVRIVKPVFDILGTVPGYREYDISSYFLVFFALFFAMIMGDAGYGLIFIILGIAMQVKAKKASDINLLLYVVGAATFVWGALTGTWFGSEGILVKLPFLQKLVFPPLANYPDLFGLDSAYTQNMLMKFCFIIGTVQLSLARVMNIIRKAREKDLSLVAEVGWLIDAILLYFLALNLVIGEPFPVSVVIKGVLIGFVLVCVFSAQGPGIRFSEGLKHGLGGFFTTFLDTISSFSNLMSYIRLFAVGMASLAIAQSFNSMGEGMFGGVLTIVGILIIILGHVLNLVMGLLSVVVHGVRLNLLEFSGALGMEWAGYNYEPFRKTVQDKAENS